jgi:hypothetical protein
VLLVANPEVLLADQSWMDAIDWSAVGGRDHRWCDEQYGYAWSRRIWLRSGIEVEILVARLSWAAISPLDAGTRRVVLDGCRILYDPDRTLERLCRAISQ